MRRFLVVLLIVLLAISYFGYRYYHSGQEKSAPADSTSVASPPVPSNTQIHVNWKPYPYIPVVDPGHGGPDGGTESISGVLESKINLDIGIKTDLILRFMGVKTVMTRDTDVSIHDPDVETASLYDRKISDLKNRVKLINQTENSVLLSIHQNFFEQSQYSGAQVFYYGEQNKAFAALMQETLRGILDPENNRQCRYTEDVYLLRNIERPGILIECGFLSNPKEEALLLSNAYQNKLAMVISKGFFDWTRGNV